MTQIISFHTLQPGDKAIFPPTPTSEGIAMLSTIMENKVSLFFLHSTFKLLICKEKQVKNLTKQKHSV